MTEEELKQRLDKAVEINNNRWHNAPLNMDFKEYEEYMSITQDVVDKLSMQYRLIQTPEMSPLRDIGDLMTLEQFVEACEGGWFIDYDGSGRYATDKEESNIGIFPSDVAAGKVRKDFSHVMWYNR